MFIPYQPASKTDHSKICILHSKAFGMLPINHWKFVVHEKNYSPDCTAGEDEGKSGYFQCAVHLPVDK